MPVIVTVYLPALLSTFGTISVIVAVISVSPAAESTLTRPYWSFTYGFHLPAGTVALRVQSIYASVLVTVSTAQGT